MIHVRLFAVLAGLIAAAASPIAAAQAVQYDVLHTSIPTLSEYGLYLLILLMAASSYWLLRKGGPGQAAGLVVLALTAGAAFLARDTQLVSEALATPVPVNVGATASGSVIIPTPPTTTDIVSITNISGSPIRVTALIAGDLTNSCDSGDYSVETYSTPPFTPGCDTNLTVAPGDKCYVRIACPPGNVD